MTDVLLIVGHRADRPGARNSGPTMEPGDDLYEYYFNAPLVAGVARILKSLDVDAEIDIYTPSSRTRSLARWNGRSRLLVEFHCNAFNRSASGTEVLYALNSKKGEDAARIMCTRLVSCLGLPNRGVKALTRADRGGHLVWGVSQVALIPEPFFIDNDHDLARAQSVNLVRAYAEGVAKILETVL